MRSPRTPVSVDTLRYAAARAVERSSLRRVADDMEMAPSWLDGFIDGRTAVPRSQTLRKLREWFVRDSAALAQMSDETTGSALTILVEGLMAEAERRQAAEEVSEVLARFYARQGAVPDWLRKLRDGEE
jgi:hypothetical protein